jgi:hypothetical protein
MNFLKSDSLNRKSTNHSRKPKNQNKNTEKSRDKHVNHPFIKYGFNLKKQPIINESNLPQSTNPITIIEDVPQMNQNPTIKHCLPKDQSILVNDFEPILITDDSDLNTLIKPILIIEDVPQMNQNPTIQHSLPKEQSILVNDLEPILITDDLPFNTSIKPILIIEECSSSLIIDLNSPPPQTKYQKTIPISKQPETSIIRKILKIQPISKQPPTETSTITEYLDTQPIISQQILPYTSRSGRNTCVKSYENLDFTIEKKKIHPFLMNAEMKREYKLQLRKEAEQKEKERKENQMVVNLVRLNEEKVLVNLVSKEFSKGKIMNPFFQRRDYLSNNTCGIIIQTQCQYPSFENFHVNLSNYQLLIEKEVAFQRKIRKEIKIVLDSSLKIVNCEQVLESVIESYTKLEVIEKFKKSYQVELETSPISKLFCDFISSHLDCFKPLEIDQLLGSCNRKTAKTVFDWLVDWSSIPEVKPARKSRSKRKSVESDSDNFIDDSESDSHSRLMCIQGPIGSGKTSLGCNK